MSTLNKTNNIYSATATDGARHRGRAKNGLSRRTCFIRSILFCIAMAVLSILRHSTLFEENSYTGGEIEVKIDDSIITRPLQPRRIKIQSRDHFFMFPAKNATSDGKPKGLLLHLHSCKQSGLDFFTLPEHRIVAYDALQKGLVVFSPTSYDRQSGCYTSEDANELLKKIVDQFVRRHKLNSLPRVGLGHSSGGAFLSLLHDRLKLQSMALYNSPEDYGDMHSKNDALIPTVYLTMSSDEFISDHMNANSKRLQDSNITSVLFKVSPMPFTQKLCVARLSELQKGVCKRMLTAIKKDKAYSSLLDANGFVLEPDVASTKWQDLFEFLELSYEGFCPIDKTIGLQYYDNEISRCSMRSVLEQEIKACYGYHAMTAQYHDEIINFLLSNSETKQNPPPQED